MLPKLRADRDRSIYGCSNAIDSGFGEARLHYRNRFWGRRCLSPRVRVLRILKSLPAVFTGWDDRARGPEGRRTTSRADFWERAHWARRSGHSAPKGCKNRTCTAQTRRKRGTYGAHSHAQTAVSRRSNGLGLVSATSWSETGLRVRLWEKFEIHDLGTTCAMAPAPQSQLANHKRVTADRSTGSAEFAPLPLFTLYLFISRWK